jgi:hypothetical protein
MEYAYKDVSLESLLAGRFIDVYQSPKERPALSFWKVVERHWAKIIAVFLLVVGGVGLLSQRWSLLTSLCEAAFIAGILSLSVDPFLKRTLAKEASQDIFQHLLGFDLPIEIRDSLKKFLFSTEHYRKDVEIVAEIKRRSDNVVAVDMTADFTVVAATNCVYAPRFACELSENVSLKEVSVTGDRPEVSYSHSNIPLVEKDDEHGVQEWIGSSIGLQKGESLRSHFRYTLERGARDFYVLYFGGPTISPRLRITCDESLECSASKADQKNGNEYVYRKVFVAGDHINVRWEPKSDSRCILSYGSRNS